MWYDTLPKDKQEEVQEGLSNFKNPEKDPELTRKFLEATLKYVAVFTPSGDYRRLGSHTKAPEHSEIRRWLDETDAKDTLEVGFAYGISALVFAEHHQRMKNSGIRHTIIDPNQFGKANGSWEGIGAENLKRVGFIKGRNYRLIEKSSVYALPRLVPNMEIDVALIDGWHTFDYTLIDVFYCLEMLRVGGVLIVDDKKLHAVKSVSEYVNRAYKHIVEVCKKCKSVLVIKKVREDTRDWDADEKVNFDLR
jgi:predicted O-methyltransferase YrrM